MPLLVPLQGAVARCRGEGDDQLWGSGRGAIAGCHCRVPEKRVTTNFGVVDVVPLLGAIAACHCRIHCRVVVPLLGAIAGCQRGG